MLEIMNRTKILVHMTTILIMAVILIPIKTFGQDNTKLSKGTTSIKFGDTQKANNTAAILAAGLRNSLREEKNVDKVMLKDVNALLAKLDGDPNFSYKLINSIGTKDIRGAEKLLKSLSKLNVKIEYDSGQIVTGNTESYKIRFCWESNGVLKCWPKQGPVDCPKF